MTSTASSPAPVRLAAAQMVSGPRVADNLAAARQWQKGTLTAAPFTLRTYEPVTPRQGDTLAVYIEGDGLAWLNPSQPSADPTPVSPLLLGCVKGLIGSFDELLWRGLTIRKQSSRTSADSHMISHR